MVFGSMCRRLFNSWRNVLRFECFALIRTRSVKVVKHSRLYPRMRCVMRQPAPERRRKACGVEHSGEQRLKSERTAPGSRGCFSSTRKICHVYPHQIDHRIVFTRTVCNCRAKPRSARHPLVVLKRNRLEGQGGVAATHPEFRAGPLARAVKAVAPVTASSAFLPDGAEQLSRAGFAGLAIAARKRSANPVCTTATGQNSGDLTADPSATVDSSGVLRKPPAVSRAVPQISLRRMR